MFSKNSFPVLLEHWRYIADLEPWITNRKSDNSQFQKKINQTQKTVFRIFVSLIISLLSRVFPFSTLIFSLFQENILIWCMLSEFRAKLISLSGSYNEEHCSTVHCIWGIYQCCIFAIITITNWEKVTRVFTIDEIWCFCVTL